jgi:hypothetical protein
MFGEGVVSNSIKEHLSFVRIDDIDEEFMFSIGEGSLVATYLPDKLAHQVIRI